VTFTRAVREPVHNNGCVPFPKNVGNPLLCVFEWSASFPGCFSRETHLTERPHKP